MLIRRYIINLSQQVKQPALNSNAIKPLKGPDGWIDKKKLVTTRYRLAYHLTVGKKRKLGQRMKDMMMMMMVMGVRGGTAIAHVAVKHCVGGSESMVLLHIVFVALTCVKIELVIHVIDVVFFFIAVHSGAP